MLRSAIAGAGLLALAAINGLPAFAQLASQDSTFTGTVPAICTVSDQVQATTPMTLSGGGTVLAGETDQFNFVSNGAVSVQLRAVDVLAQPTGTGAYSFDGRLEDSGTSIATATPSSASSLVAYNGGLGGNEDFTMGLDISAPGGAVLAAGTYTAKLTTDCIAGGSGGGYGGGGDDDDD